MFRFSVPLLVGILGIPGLAAQTIDINVLLDSAPTASVLDAFEDYSTVLDIMPEIDAIRVCADAGLLNTIKSLPHVKAADPDDDCPLLGMSAPFPSDFTAGENVWNLDAINVTNFAGGRTIPYDGDGVYVAVIDSGLPHNWREYFPEERIASEFAISFGAGGSEHSTISTQPQKWQKSTNGHGTWITSVILGFSYYGTQIFNGVAPRAKVIPVRTYGEDNMSPTSVNTRAILYVASLKTSGALGSAPVIMNLSFGGPALKPLMQAAIDYAIARGVVVVAAAGNLGDAGMVYPAGYPEVISTGAVGWVREFPADDPTEVWWLLRDVPEANPMEFFVANLSSRELPGQDLDLLAPGYVVPAAYTRAGQPDYTFVVGTSHACPHAVGVAALMLQKNPDLTQAQIEAILEATALPFAPGCATPNDPVVEQGNEPTWSDHENVIYVPTTHCWAANATGHGLLDAAAALGMTPFP